MSRETGRTTLFHLADLAYAGQLEPTLRRWRAAGVSFRAIQGLLEHDLGVRIALETIRRWVVYLDADRAA